MFSIKNLYLGNYVPIESICDSDNSKEALRTICNCEAKLNCSLSNEQKALLETILEKQGIIVSETAMNHFKGGVKLGVQLMADCVSK